MDRKRRRDSAGSRCQLLWRAALLGSTCIVAFTPMAVHAQSQIPANTTPSGGVVTGGSSSISQTPGLTTITQTSPRTAINWQSYNVGSNATVQYQQPSANAAALNVVVTPSPSIIAGSIKANGQIIIVNQSGVLFTRGSEVNAQSVIATTSNLSSPAFMAGKLVTTGGPRPGASIINDGVITARQAGLVGLIAPQVANNGIIIAVLGQVVLAGADAFTLDLYGDKLMSLDVTKSVQAVDVGGKLVPALVTNRGIILALGGKVSLTAQDADALVTQLVDAGGAIIAPTVGSSPGSIDISGIGGNIKIAGVLLAPGITKGAKGGTIQAVTDGKIAVASTAIIVASGVAGGGVIALGTDAARAIAGAADRTASKASAVTIAAGAQLLSDAVSSGNGGTIAVLSSNDTHDDGNISVQGAAGGTGGSVEVGSNNSITVDGAINDAAPGGQGGAVLLEGASLTVGGNISPEVLDQVSGSLTLDAGTLISVIDPLNIRNAAVSMVSGGDVSIGSEIDVASTLGINAANALTIDGGLNASEMSLNGGDGIAINAPIDPLGILHLTSNGSIIESDAGSIDAGTLTGMALGDVVLDNAANTISTLGRFSAANFSLADSVALDVTGPLQAGDVSLSGTAIDFGGDVMAGNLNLTSLGSIGQNTGTITAGTLMGTASGDVDLNDPGNAIGLIGGFSAANFSLTDAVALGITGPLQAGDIDLSATAIDFNGNVSASNLTLASLGGISQNAGTITAATLTGTDGDDVTLDQTGNSITTLGSFSAANFGLADAATLSVTGPLQANGNLGLNAAAIDLNGDVTTGNLTLASLGGITQNTGTITAATLTGSASGDVDLADTGNRIANLGSFSADNFSLADAAALGISGPLQATGIIDLSATSINFSGNVNASNLSLASLGTISQNAGTITAGTLSGSAAADVTLNQTGNDIATLGGFSAPDFNLKDAVALGINGPLQVNGNLGLTAAAIDLNSDVTSGNLALTSLGSIGQSSGTISAATLTGMASGDLDLNDTGNRIANLASFSAADFSLADAAALTVTGPLHASGNIDLNAASIDFNGNVNASSLVFASFGSISQTSGTITAATLSGTAAADVTLDQTGNDIASLGSLSAPDFNLMDSVTLNIAGPLQINGNLGLSATAIDFNGNVNTGNLAIASLGGVTQNSGTITANSLTGMAAGNVDLDDPGNRIANLGGFSAGNFSLTDSAALRIAGPLQAGDINLTATSIDFDGDVTASNLSLASLGTIGQNSGTIAAATLSGNAADVTLDQTGNSIATIGSFTAPDFSLTDSVMLTVSGPLQVNGNLDLTAATIDFGGNVTTGSLALASLGGITQNAGTITAATLTGTASGDVALMDNGNRIANLGSFSAADFNLADAAALTVTGPLRAVGDVGLSATSIDFSGNVNAGNLSLTSLGIINQNAGIITAGTLTGSAAADVTLDHTGNSIATIGAFSTPDFSLTDAVALSIAGPMQVNGNLDLAATAINFNGNVTTGNLALTSLGSINQSSGTITANALTGTAAGNVDLDDAGNRIANLDGFSAANFSLADAAALTVSGPLQAGNIGLTGSAIDLAGNIDAGTRLALGSTGAITQTAGTLSTPLLTSLGTIGGNVSLNQPGNAITSLGGFAVNADLLLNDAIDLTISGLVRAADATINAPAIDLTGTLSAAGNLNLNNTATGGIVISGEAVAGNAIHLTSSGGVTETANGAVIAPTLSGVDSGGDVNLDSANNRISTLAGYALPNNDFALDDQSALTITGPVSAANAAIAAAAIDFEADITTGNLNLASQTSITQGNGTIAAATLMGAAGGDVTLDQSGNVIPVLGNFTANGNVSLTDASALDLQGLINTEGHSLSLFTTGAIDQTSGLISTAVLNATAPGISLPQANQIGMLGNISTGNLYINGDNGIAGLVQAQNATLVSAGNIALTGSIAISNNLSLTAAGNITQPTGDFYTQNATFSTTQPGDAIILDGDDTIPGTLSFSNAGEVVHDAGNLDAGILTGTAGTLASFTGATDFGTIASFVMSDSLFDLKNTGDLTLTGPLVANNISISTTRKLILNGTADGGLFFTGSEASPIATAPRPGIDSVLRAASIVETGTFYLNAGPNSPFYNSAAYLGTTNKRATIFMVTAATPNIPGGNIQFSAAPAGVFGPAVNVVLNAGTTGLETGNVDLYHLEILGGKSANLAGIIDGIKGQPAAGRASAYPYPSSAYQLNGCTIGSLNCFILAIEGVPVQNPLERFDLTHRKRHHLGKNVQLPGIATHDF